VVSILCEEKEKQWVNKFIQITIFLSNSFIYQLMHNRFVLKNIKIYIKTASTCFGLITIIRVRII